MTLCTPEGKIIPNTDQYDSWPRGGGRSVIPRDPVVTGETGNWGGTLGDLGQRPSGVEVAPDKTEARDNSKTVISVGGQAVSAPDVIIRSY